MPLAHTVVTFPPLDYIEWEKSNAIKHEYLDGKVFAMAGGSDRHVTAVGNIFAILRNHVRGGNCRSTRFMRMWHGRPLETIMFKDAVI